MKIAYSKNKIAAFSETGQETFQNDKWFTEVLPDGIKSDAAGSRIAYIMVWRNAWTHYHFASYPGHPGAPDLKKFRGYPLSLFADDPPKMYKNHRSSL